MWIDRIAPRGTQDDASMQTPVWPMLVDMMLTMVYMVLVLLVVWPVLMTVMRLPMLMLSPPVLLPLAMMLVVSQRQCCYT